MLEPFILLFHNNSTFSKHDLQNSVLYARAMVKCVFPHIPLSHIQANTRYFPERVPLDVMLPLCEAAVEARWCPGWYGHG